MLYVNVDDKKGGLERAIKKLKEKFRKTNVVKELRERSEFRKPSTVRRSEKMKAIYKQLKETQEQNNK